MDNLSKYLLTHSLKLLKLNLSREQVGNNLCRCEIFWLVLYIGSNYNVNLFRKSPLYHFFSSVHWH